MAPSAPMFLSHYTIRLGKKIKALGEGSLCIDRQPMPLYWRLPLKAPGTHKSQLSLEEKVALQLLDELPRGMNCKEIVSLVIGRKPVSHLRRMIEDEGIDMTALIRKVKLARGAESGLKPEASMAEMRSAPVAERQSALVAERQLAPVAGKESAPAAEEVVVSVAAGMKTTSVQAEKGSAQVEARPSIPYSEAREAKRKVEAVVAGEASQKKGKSMVPYGLTPVGLPEKSRVTITSGPKLPLGGLSCFGAPVDVRSLWGPNMDVHNMFPPSFIPQYDQRLLVSTGIDGTFHMLEAYHIQSLASLEVSRGLVKRTEHILLKEAFNKKEFEKVTKANHDLRAEGERLKAEVAKLKADQEGLWADLSKSKSEAASMGSRAAAVEAEAVKMKVKAAEAEAGVANWKVKAATSEAEMAKLKAALALAQKASKTMSRDLNAARCRMAEVEIILASDREAKTRIGAALKTIEAKNTALEAEIVVATKERQRLTNRVERLEGVIVDQHEDGFNKALRQIALLAPDFDLSPYSMTKEIKDGKLVSLLDPPPK
ncbi:hypothetical protein CR513_62386, partial [Mucuna pruriens]